MEIRVLHVDRNGQASLGSQVTTAPPDGGWSWVDVTVAVDDYQQMARALAGLGLDEIALRAAIHEFKLPRFNDLGEQIHLVLHDLHGQRIAPCVISCFLLESRLITLHTEEAPSVSALFNRLTAPSSTTPSSPDQALALLLRTASRRQLAVLAAYEQRVEGLVRSALAADPNVLGRIMAIRSDLASVRRSARPQRAAVDELRDSLSTLVSNEGRRQLMESYDASDRVVQEVDASRVSLREILDGYRGAETARATDVTTILTLYAAVFLPLSILTGYFGMSLPGLLGTGTNRAWIWVTLAMIAISIGSVAFFVRRGWMRGFAPPTIETESSTLAEAARRPVQITDIT